jgi:hypothetical protein
MVREESRSEVTDGMPHFVMRFIESLRLDAAPEERKKLRRDQLTDGAPVDSGVPVSRSAGGFST